MYKRMYQKAQALSDYDIDCLNEMRQKSEAALRAAYRMKLLAWIVLAAGFIALFFGYPDILVLTLVLWVMVLLYSAAVGIAVVVSNLSYLVTDIAEHLRNVQAVLEAKLGGIQEKGAETSGP